MPLAIVAYPSLDETDRQWIESFRAKHDPQSPRIDVHFTLVFPVEIPPSDLEPELIAVAETTQSISFALVRAQVVPDVSGQGHHVFLVPAEGGVQITALHDRLYAGILKRHLRSDIPFVPHMTVGALPDSGAAEQLAGELQAQARLVRGLVSRIDMVDVSTHRVQIIASYALRPLQDQPEMSSITLGAEHDSALWSRLEAAVAARGGAIVESFYGVGGSQEIIVYEVTLPAGRLQITSETYMGLLLEGPAQLVRELANEIGGRG